jgi:glycosyltransferase involved in cell wall biosynthesis
VSREELLSLYSNALFTAFPFTNEPFGSVPLESISCGTPVLTYNKQGPSETLVNGETGWLVNSSDEFVSKAVDIWKRGTTGIKAEVCVNAALPYSIENTEMYLLKYLNHS